MEKEIKVSVTVTAKDLFWFMLQHTYRSVGGVLSILFSVGALGLLFYCFDSVDWPYRVTLIIASLLFTVINPCLLYRRSVRQVKRTPGFSEPIEYTFTKKGFAMKQGEGQAEALWSDLWRIRDGKRYLYLYGNSIRANIIPKSQLDGRASEITQLIKESQKRVWQKM